MWCRERRLAAEFGQRLIGALGVEGLRAPAFFDSPSFLAYVEQVLVEVIKSFRRGAVT
jgi:hypothetical protein